MLQLLRIFFKKMGTAAYISHLDLQRVMARGLRKSGLPVWWSQGFNPHIYMTFALPLPLLHESVCECVDVKTESEEDDFSRFVPLLSDALPEGIEVTAIAFPKYGAEDIASARYRIAYPVAVADAARLAAVAAGYAELEKALVVRKTKRTETEIDLKEVLPRLVLAKEEDAFEVYLPAGSKTHYSPALLTAFLQQKFLLSQAAVSVLRQAVFCRDGTAFC